MLKEKLNKLFSNIGEKMKLTAIICFCIYILGAVAGSIYLCFFDTWMFILLPVFLLAGLFISWLLSIPLYGFGELIAKICSSDAPKASGNPSYEASLVQKQSSADEKKSKLDKLYADGIISEDEYNKAIIKNGDN